MFGWSLKNDPLTLLNKIQKNLFSKKKRRYWTHNSDSHESRSASKNNPFFRVSLVAHVYNTFIQVIPRAKISICTQLSRCYILTYDIKWIKLTFTCPLVCSRSKSLIAHTTETSQHVHTVTIGANSTTKCTLINICNTKYQQSHIKVQDVCFHVPVKGKCKLGENTLVHPEVQNSFSLVIGTGYSIL